MTPTYLNIALPVPLRRTFHYLPPAGILAEQCQSGCRIEVPFRSGNMVGVITGHSEVTDFAGKIKPARHLIDETPVFSKSTWDLCLWAAEYYHHPLGEVLNTALPVLLRQGDPAAGNVRKLMPLSQDLDALNRAPRQRALLAALGSHGLTKAELKSQDFTSATIRAVIERGYAEWQEFSIDLEPAIGQPEFGPSLALSEEQQIALAQLETTGTHLLFGVTGSGKTELYLQAIEAAIKAGKQALMLVPEIGLTPQTVARFEQRFPGMVVAMHSAMNNTERLTAWRRARAGNIKVVIGTRSAIFTPLPNTGLIVVDEEHDASFKQQDGFRYSARDLAVKRGQLETAAVILGSATPSLETYANAAKGRYRRLDLRQRANQAQHASYQIIGTEHQTLSEGLSPQLIAMMKNHLANNNQVLVFLNRRGFAPVLHCRQCRWLSNCSRCDSRMTFHLSTGKIVCHHCDHQTRAPRHCPDCGSTELVPLGLGTQRIETGLKNVFPQETIVRIDRDSTRRKNQLAEKLAQVHQGERCILLGTQLLAKGHHFPDVTLVAVVDLDAGLFSSDYHAVERMGQMLLQVGGRAGREQKPGTVAIQTLYPELPMLNLLIQQGYEAFCQALLEERKESLLPPFTFQAIIRAEAVHANIALRFLEETTHITTPDTVELLGPIPAPMEKRAGRYRAQLLVSSESRAVIHQTLKALVRVAEQSPLANKVRWSVDIDPYDLF
ncbi:MAG: primosomal protein N' [Pseudomonadales bacterium]